MVKWATIQPLTGGMPLGYEEIFGLPEFIINNSANNTLEYINYCKQRGHNIPVINMDWDLTTFLTEEDEILFNKVNNDIKLMVAVPICSGLSMLNNCTTGCSARGDADNKQNQNMYNLSKFILQNIKPDVMCFENAPNAYSSSGKGVLDNLIKIGKDNSYSLSIEKVDTYDHGIPQHRQRTFVYYWNSKTSPYLKYEKVKTPNLIDYFSLIPKNSSKQDIYPVSKTFDEDYTYECIQDLYNKNKHKSIIDVILEIDSKGKNTSSLGFLNDTGFEQPIKWAENKINESLSNEDETAIKKYTKALNKFKHCKSKVDDGKSFWDATISIATHRLYINALIGKNINGIVHPMEDRSLNLRELTFLMGMPNDFELTNDKNFIMLTQNVPVCTAKHSAYNCSEFINSNLKMSRSSFIKQNNIKESVDYESNDIKEENW